MKRLFDILLSIGIFIVFAIPILLISILVKSTSKGPIIYWSKRVGKNNLIFNMPKFRTMKLNTPTVATHLLTNSLEFLTPVGSFLRKTSLDELPQLYSIIVGDMSFVGPRPALFNQYDLIQMRTEKGVHLLLPGLTGLAQVNGRDEISLEEKVEFDYKYLASKSLVLDLKIIFTTLLKVLKSDSITH